MGAGGRFWPLNANPGDTPDPAKLKRFIAQGRKMILWCGASDPSAQAVQPIALCRERAALQNGLARRQASVRLFLVPRMRHCSRGASPDQFDTLSALEAGAGHGKAPNAIQASTNPDSPVQHRLPLCPYPQQGRYRGPGEINDPAKLELRRGGRPGKGGDPAGHHGDNRIEHVARPAFCPAAGHETRPGPGPSAATSTRRLGTRLLRPGKRAGLSRQLMFGRFHDKARAVSAADGVDPAQQMARDHDVDPLRFEEVRRQVHQDEQRPGVVGIVFQGVHGRGRGDRLAFVFQHGKMSCQRLGRHGARFVQSAAGGDAARHVREFNPIVAVCIFPNVGNVRDHDSTSIILSRFAARWL